MLLSKILNPLQQNILAARQNDMIGFSRKSHSLRSPQSHMLSKLAADSSNFCEIRCCSLQIQSSWNSLSLPRWAEIFNQTILLKNPKQT